MHYILAPFVVGLPSCQRYQRCGHQDWRHLSGKSRCRLIVQQHKASLGDSSHTTLYTKNIQFVQHNDFGVILLHFSLSITHYIQTKGTAMGMICAPNDAILFLGWWEHTVVFMAEMSHFKEHILFWGRFIDDVFILWEGDEHLFQDFVQTLNINDLGMHFTSEIHTREITFLDLNITTDHGGCIHTDVYRKSTPTNSCLQWQSCHPPALQRGIPAGQYLRAHRHCSDEESFEREASNRYQGF